MGTFIKPQSKTFLIKKAWITEKAGRLIELNKYVFIVDKKMNKPEVAKAIESMYGVKVSLVNILNKQGKIKRLGKNTGKISGYKKAVITLEKGNKIEVMPT